MSARRNARAQVVPRLRGRGAIPTSLQLGPCIEVWALDPDDEQVWLSARRRWGAAETAWRRVKHIDGRGPLGSSRYRLPWSVEFLSNRGPEGAALAIGRLSDAGCDFDDIPTLRDEATRLLKKATRIEGNY